MYKIILFFILCLIGFSGIAQKSKKERREEKKQRINALIRQEEEGVIAHRKHTAFGLKLTTDGYGGFLEIGRAKSVKSAMLYQLEISERKHLKEEKQSGEFTSTVPFIYGKQNFVYDVKIGVQHQMLLANKSNKNGVSISANFGGGINMALLRPYYVQVFDSPNSTTFIKYDSPDSSLFLNNFAIIGGPNFGKGWGELKVNPGFYAKGAVRFDYGKYNEMVSAIEVGVGLDFYTKKLAQMVYVNQRQTFLNAYIALVFGQRK
jgi:hypothetical protein